MNKNVVDKCLRLKAGLCMRYCIKMTIAAGKEQSEAHKTSLLINTGEYAVNIN